MKTIRRLLALALLSAAGLFASLPVAVAPLFGTDGDGDGLSAELEAALGTSDSDSDSDDDGWGDYLEVFTHGTSPCLADTDGDSLGDSVDPAPLDDGDSVGGETTPSRAYATNLDHAAMAGTTPFEGQGVNALSGELEMVLVRMDFGPGLMGENVLELRYLSGITLNGPWGRNVVCNWDDWVVVQEDDDVEVYRDGRRFVFDEDSGAYTAPAGVPFSLELDSPAGEYVLTALRGGKAWRFDATTGLLASIEDRFGNALTVTRDQAGLITSFTLPEGNEITVSAYVTGRYQLLFDWATTNRNWELRYNCADELAKFIDPANATTQFFWLNGSQDPDLNGNLVRVLRPEGQTALTVEYDESDRVTEQTVTTVSASFSYTSTVTTVTDFAGNCRTWNHAAGEVVPTSLIVQSNRDVREGDPATWTTTFGHCGV